MQFIEQKPLCRKHTFKLFKRNRFKNHFNENNCLEKTLTFMLEVRMLCVEDTAF